jgi:hypothetical protein
MGHQVELLSAFACQLLFFVLAGARTQALAIRTGGYQLLSDDDPRLK